MAEEIQLGDLAQDVITGFKGIVVARTEWLFGCRRLMLQPMDTREGKPIESASFDEPQLVLVQRAPVRFNWSVLQPQLGAQVEPRPRTGGPAPEPVRHTDPKEH